MRIVFGLIVLSAVVFVIAGCGQKDFPEDEFGTLIFEVSEVPGADQPYEMPELGPPPEGYDRKPGDRRIAAPQ